MYGTVLYIFLRQVFASHQNILLKRCFDALGDFDSCDSDIIFVDPSFGYLTHSQKDDKNSFL